MSALNTLKIRVVLQGRAKYRVGRKWKNRFCLLALSPRNPDAMHFYITKSYDEFTPYRNHGCMVDVQPPHPARSSREVTVEGSGKVPHSCGYVETGLDCLISTRTNPVDNSVTTAGPLVNTAADTCTSVAEATSAGLSAAASLASTLNGPAPLDEVTGFESGYHMDKESNIIVLLGSTSAYVIALEGTDEMFRWADTMSQIMTDTRFRVTLRSTEGSKLSPGLQGSLHVQHWRLCLIGEPSAGCKFICSWRLDAIEQAHTMTAVGSGNVTGGSTATGTNVADTGSSTGISSSAGASFGQGGSRGSFASESLNETIGTTGSHHRVSLGNLSMLSGSSFSTVTGSANQSSRSGIAATNAAARPKHLLIIEANNSAGKGRGTHTFELDGGSLPKLTLAIEQLMALRYNPNGFLSRTQPYSQSVTNAPSHANSADSVIASGRLKDTFVPELGQSKEMDLASSSYSSDASSSRHSISPAQRFSLIKFGEPNLSSPRRHSPLAIPTPSTECASLSVTAAATDSVHHQTHIYGQSVPVSTSSRYPYYNLTRPYSNLISSSSSLSPSDGLPSGVRKHSDALVTGQLKRSVRRSVPGQSDLARTIGACGATTLRSSAVQMTRKPGDYLIARSASPQESESLLTDEIERHLSQSVSLGSQFARGCSVLRHQPSMHTTTTWSHSTNGTPCLAGAVLTNLASGTVSRRAEDSYVAGRSWLGSGDSTDGTVLLGEEHQPNVAHVASGVIISKNPLNPHPNRSSVVNGFRRTIAAPPLPPPLRDSARAKHEVRTQAYQNVPAALPAGLRGLDKTEGDSSNGLIQKSLSRPCRCRKTSGAYRHHHHACRHTALPASESSATAYPGSGVAGPSPGVFTADEDLWNTDEIAHAVTDQYAVSPVTLQSGAISPGTGLSVPLQNHCAQDSEIPSIWSASIAPGVSSTELTSFDPSLSKGSSAVGLRSMGTTPQCSCDPKSHEVLESKDYRVYRHRCRQYRVCTCLVLQTRSLSSDASLVLELNTNQRYNHQHQSSLFPAGCHSWEDVELDRNSGVLTVESGRGGPWDAPPIDSVRVVNDPLSDTTGSYAPSRSNKRHLMSGTGGNGGRSKPLHWLFHRKHSKSHDNLPSVDKLESIEHPISVSVTEGDLGARHPNARRSYSDVPAPPPQLRLHGLPSWIDPKHTQLILRCPRHGVQPYRPWFTLLQHSMLARYLCSYCRKRTLRPRPPTATIVSGPTKHSRRCVFRHFTQPALLGSSGLLNIKHLLQLRRRMREPKHSTVSSRERLESSSSPVPPANRSRTRSEARRVEIADDRGLISGQVMPQNEGITARQSTSQFSSSPKHNRWRCKRHSRSLYSVVLACSEPSVSRFTSPWTRESRSHHSSLSSLLTCRSFSASSSLSACYPVGFSGDQGPNVSQRKPEGKIMQSNHIPCEPVSGPHDSIDLITETRSCSLCDTDDLSSGSMCDECCLMHEHARPETTGNGTGGGSNSHPHHHNLFVDCHSSGKIHALSVGLSSAPHSSTDPDCGLICHPHHTHPRGPSKFSSTERRTLSLCNPTEMNVSSHPLAYPTEVSRLDKSYTTPPAPHHPIASYTQRASTLPSTKTLLHSRSDRTTDPISGYHDSVEEVEVEEAGADILNGLIHRPEPQCLSGRNMWTAASGSIGFDRIVPSARHPHGTVTVANTTPTSTSSGSHRHLRYGPMTTSSNVSRTVGSMPATGASSGTSTSRKLSSQSDVGVVNRLLEEGTGKVMSGDRLTTELPIYCNVIAGQRGVSPDMPASEVPSGKPGPLLSAAVLETNSNCEHTPSCYVNLPSNWSSPANANHTSHTTAPVTTNSSLAARFKLFVHTLHLSNSSSSNSSSSSSVTNGAGLPATSTISDSRSSSKGIDLSSRTSAVRTQAISHRVPADTTGGTESKSTGQSSVNSTLNTNLFTVPDEVRDPSRNYAIVDLRPSPASSVNANTEPSLGASYHQLATSRMEEITSTGSSAASILGFSTSTSTGSDCTSDAATLTSDMMDGFAPSVSTEVTDVTNPPRSHAGPKEPVDPPARSGSEFSRRRHSHSLSSAVTDPRTLNYVHVIATTAPLSTPSSARRDGCSTVSEPIVCSIPEHTDSHSSSSGLGGIASHSITPPLAPASSASFGEIFTSRSMTSSATSSGEGGNAVADAGFQSYSPPEADTVEYTLIDFTRTMALGELSGDMVEQQQQQQHDQSHHNITSKTSGTNTHFRWSQPKPTVDRSSSVRKSLSRSLRSIRRGTQKKPGVFLNNNG